MEGDAGASRLNRTDADNSSERVGRERQVGSIVRGAFNPADLQRLSPQYGPVGGANLARPA
jgi:hypothetical protein